jgi:hypothetical protein
MTSSTDPEEIRAEIERTRAALSSNVDALTDTANPKNIANRQVDKVKGAAVGIKERIMGAPDDPDDGGAVGDATGAVQDKVSAVGDAVQGRAAAVGDAVQDRAAAVGDAVQGGAAAVGDAPAQVKRKAQGNPLAAGLIAFGAGLLISSLIPASQREQDAVSGLQKNLEPLKEKATDAAKEIAGNLREPAQQAAESLKATAADAVQNVKDEGVAAKDQVQGQVAESKDTVQGQVADSKDTVQSKVADSKDTVQGQVADSKDTVQGQVAESKEQF